MTNEIAPQDWMAVMLAREIQPGDTLGVGLASPLAAAAALARARTDPSVTIIIQSAISANGTLADIALGLDRLRDKAAAWIDHGTLLALNEGGAIRMQFLRPAQIDGEGNLNSSRVRDGAGNWLPLPGGMAQADSAVLARRIVAYHPDHRLRSFPARVDFVTASGAGAPDLDPPRVGVVSVITDLAVIRFERKGPRLEGYRPGTSVEHIVQSTGFALLGLAEAQEIVPDRRALESIREADPDDLQLLEFPGRRAEALDRLASDSHAGPQPAEAQ